MNLHWLSDLANFLSVSISLSLSVSCCFLCLFSSFLYHFFFSDSPSLFITLFSLCVLYHITSILQSIFCFSHSTLSCHISPLFSSLFLYLFILFSFKSFLSSSPLHISPLSSSLFLYLSIFFSFKSFLSSSPCVPQFLSLSTLCNFFNIY